MINRIRLLFLGTSLSALAGLAGCGSDDSPAPAPLPAPAPAPVASTPSAAPAPTPAPPALPTSIANIAVNGIAKQSVSLVGIAYARTGNTLVSLSDDIIPLTRDTGGSRTFEQPCARSGTASTAITKTSARAGFQVGDTITITFNACASATFTRQGVVRVVPLAPINPATTAFDLNYEATLTDYSITTTATNLRITHAGKVRVSDALVNNGTRIDTVYTFNEAYVTNGSDYGLDFSPGMTIESQGTVATSATARTIKGSATVRYPAGTVQALSGGLYALSTQPALVGAISSDGFYTPTSGLLAITSPSGTKIQIELNGGFATVRGDTDRDGVFETSFTSTWQSLRE
jgi:hypothetical protein